MNYIWDLVIHTDRRRLPREQVLFAPALSYSPYIELAFVNLNTVELEDTRVEVNPFYRYDDAFGELLHYDVTGDRPLREAIFDLSIHILAHCELTRGLGKKDFYKIFIWREMLQGIWGSEIREAIELFDIDERNIVLTHLVGQYATGPSVSLIRSLMRNLYHNSIVYQARDVRNLLMIYLGAYETVKEVKRARALMELFLPLHFTVELYYEKHFGIIGVEETMVVDEIEIC